MQTCIRLGDSDAAGVVYYPRLASLAHDAYEAEMQRLGLDLAELIRSRRLGLPVIEASQRFLAPLRHGDTYRTEISCLAVGERSYRVRIAFVTAIGEAAWVEQVHCAIDPASGAACRLPEEVSAALRRLGGIAAD
jgi:acyl-CoA thioesterase FadM